MTIDEGIALIAVHLGVVDEDAILNMSYLFFEDVLGELGKKLNYDAVVNLAGNAFAKDGWKAIQEANPMMSNRTSGGFVDFFNKQNIKVVKSKGKGSGGHGRIED